MFGKPRKPNPFFKGTAPCEKYGVFLFYVWSQTGLTFLRPSVKKLPVPWYRTIPEHVLAENCLDTHAILKCVNERQRKIVYSSPLQESSMSVTPPFPFRANTIPGLRYASLSLN